MSEQEKNKVLIAAPTAKIKDYCFKKWCENVKSFTYKDFDVLLVDNTPDGGVYNSKLNHYFKSYHIEPENETNRETILRCQKFIRNYMLSHDYDYLFSLETDIFPPVNCIEYLLNLKKEVVGLPYFVGQAYYSKPMLFEIEDFGIIRLAKPMNVDKAFFYFDGTVKEAYQTGLGCLLIKRHIIEKIKFRIDINDPAKPHADVYFHADLDVNKIPVYISTSIICKHYNKNWKQLNIKI